MTERFYPSCLPEFENEPTTDRFEIRYVDDGIGQGVVTLVPFEPGEIVFRFTGFLSTEITQFSLQIRESLHLHDPYFMGKILHSCDPNTVCDMEKRTFTATKHIEPGSFVTMDYAQTEDYLFKSFPCSCGAANCRGYVTGRLQRIESPNGVAATPNGRVLELR